MTGLLFKVRLTLDVGVRIRSFDWRYHAGFMIFGGGRIAVHVCVIIAIE